MVTHLAILNYMDTFLDEFRAALISFFETLNADQNWRGKEREIISRFAFSNLISLVRPGTALHSPGQIGIEVRVIQTAVTDTNKKEVCKDLIIWQSPHKTAFFEPYESPLMIIEWKYNEAGYEDDIEWLKGYVAVYPDTVGVAVNIVKNDGYSVTVSLVRNGDSIQVDEGWINL